LKKQTQALSPVRGSTASFPMSSPLGGGLPAAGRLGALVFGGYLVAGYPTAVVAIAAAPASVGQLAPLQLALGNEVGIATHSRIVRDRVTEIHVD
jgi:hypothetical protein